MKQYRVVVVLENRIYVYNFADLRLIDAIDIFGSLKWDLIINKELSGHFRYTWLVKLYIITDFSTIDPGYADNSGVKKPWSSIFGTVDIIIKDNTLHDNKGNGIFMD